MRLASRDREIVRLALPAMAALAADPMLSLVDTALVGRLGAVPLAALGVTVALFTLAFFGFNFLTYGTTAEVARLRGAGRPGEAATYALQALWLAIGLGIATTVVLEAFAPLLLTLMGARGEVADAGLVYLRIRALATLPVLVVLVGHGAFRGCKDMRTPLWIAVAVNAANAVVSWTLIYPVGLGIAGAAWGTVLAQTAGAATFLVLGRRRLAPPDLRIDPRAMRRIAGISRDLFLRTAALLTGLLISTAVAARMGTITVAAHQIARELWTMLALVQDGFAIAGQAMIGTALGAGRPAEARDAASRLLGWGVAFGFLVGIAYLALAGVLPGVFTTDPRVIAAVGGVWLIVALLQPVGGVVFVLDGILMGAGDFRFLWWSTALASLGGLVPVCLLALRHGWGLQGIWAGMAVLMLVRAALTMWRLRTGAWALVAAPAPAGQPLRRRRTRAGSRCRRSTSSGTVPAAITAAPAKPAATKPSAMASATTVEVVVAPPLRSSRTRSMSPMVRPTTSRIVAPPSAAPTVMPWLRRNWCAAVARPSSSSSATARSNVSAALVPAPTPVPSAVSAANTDHNGASAAASSVTASAPGSASAKPPAITVDSAARSSTREDTLAPAVQPTVKNSTDQAVMAVPPPRPPCT